MFNEAVNEIKPYFNSHNDINDIYELFKDIADNASLQYVLVGNDILTVDMTQEDKELLLKDLCGRLPYGVKVEYENEVFDVEYVCPMYEEVKLDILETWTIDVLDIKPYLFPLSSMTEEQKKEYRKACDLDMGILENSPMKGEPFPAMYNSQDWLDAHHFDYRSLIENGLAIAVTKENNPYEV